MFPVEWRSDDSIRLKLIIFQIIGTAIGYDLRCPVQQEWRLRAQVYCFTEDKYVCLFNLLKKKYQADCSGSSQSRKGKVFLNLPINHTVYKCWLKCVFAVIDLINTSSLLNKCL